jgi:hypothetical protein
MLNKENKNGFGATVELNRTTNTAQQDMSVKANGVAMSQHLTNSRTAASAKQQMHLLHMQQQH